MNILELILSPFIFIIEQVFLFSYSVTGNYGLSIILLSFAVSTALLPIFIFIEKAKKKDDTVKSKMKPLIAEIKRCYKGQERYYYIKTINRQYNYSTLRALIPILSLLLQIPFFIAAYQFLENYDPLNGVSFLFINDLNSPDGLLGAVNILPILMTVINLLTAYFYTRNGDVSERKQMTIVAGIFLLLLFKLPSGLVLYWTMNNFFSFLRLFITNPEAFKKARVDRPTLKSSFAKLKVRLLPLLPKLKNTFLLISAIAVLFQLNLAMESSFHGFLLNMASALGISFSITLFIALLTLIHKQIAVASNTNTKAYFLQLWPTFKPLFFTLLFLTVASQINWLLHNSFDTVVPRLFMALIASIFITLILSLTVLIYQGHITISSDKLSYKFSTLNKKYKSALLILLSLTTLTQIVWSYYSNSSNIIIKISVLGTITWLLIVFLANLKTFHKYISIPQLIGKITRIKTNSTVFFSICFLSIYFYLAGKYYYSGINSTLHLIAFLFMIISMATGLLYFSRMQKRTNKIIFNLSIVLFAALLLFQLVNIAGSLFATDSEFKLFITHTFSLEVSFSTIILIGIIITLGSLPYFWKFNQVKIKAPKKANWFIFILASFYLTSLIFFWRPLIVYASFPEAFSFPAIVVLSKNFTPFAIAFIVIVAVYFLISKKLKFTLTTLLVTLSLVYFLNSFIIPINVGSLQLGKYVDAENLSMEPVFYILEGLFLILSFLWVKKLLQSKYKKQIVFTLLALILILISQSITKSSSNGEFFKKNDNLPKLSSTLSFSKNKENIIYIIPDMFMGMHMKKILEENPELKEVYSGFKWYPNTLSVSTNTCPSICSLYDGPNSNIDKLNMDNINTMGEKITKASEIFSHKIRAKGYKLTSTQMVFSDIDKNTYDSYIPLWHSDWNKWNKTLNIGGDKELDFTILWKNAMFYGLPLFLKPKFYDDGNWIHIEEETNKNTILTQDANFIRLLPYISDTLTNDKNFIYIHSEVTHSPWNLVNDMGELQMNVTSYENQKWFIHSFAKWIIWMKANDVYDNTKIIMLSDHGPNVTDEQIADLESNWNITGQNIVSANDFWRVNALLMVKDINSKEPLTEDWRLMSNSDAPAIVFNENDPTKSKNPESRTLPVFFVKHQAQITSKKNLEIINLFLVTDNIYDPNNWQKINQQ